MNYEILKNTAVAVPDLSCKPFQIGASEGVKTCNALKRSDVVPLRNRPRDQQVSN